jgi:acetyl-CoA carboxylase biotin carboxyl carrier protein
MMELEKVRELIDMMKANDLSELEIVDGQTRIVLKRGASQSIPQVVAQPVAIPAPSAAMSPAAGAPASAPSESVPKEEVEQEAKLSEIISPIVGTYYSAPSPNADSFVEVGSKVDEETVVCIIEAMKVMNEIKSGISGTIKEILVNNGSAVEYGQRLFLVEPE